MSWKPYLKGVKYCSQLDQSGILVNLLNKPDKMSIGIKIKLVKALTLLIYLNKAAQKKPSPQPTNVKMRIIKAK